MAETNILSLEEAANAAIENLDSGPEAETVKTATEAEEAPEQPDTEATADAEIEADAEQPDSDDDDSDDAEDVEQSVKINPDSTYEIDGQVYTGQELLSGYQREGDYTQKSQRLAEERKAVAESAQYVDAERKAVTDMMPKLQAYEKALAPVFQMGAQLQNSMSQMTQEQQQVAQMVISQLSQAANGAKSAIESMGKTIKSASDSRTKESLNRLKQYNSNWGPNVYSDVKAHAMSHFGYSAEQVDSIDDWRIMQAIAESQEFQKLKTSAKTQPVPKDPVKLKSKKRRAQSQAGIKQKELQKRASSARGIHDQLDAFSDLLANEANSKR